MTVRVLIESDFQFDGIKIHVGDKVERGLILILDGGLEQSFVEAGTTNADTRSFARIRDDVGMALRDALIVHYGGAPETQWLRRDYDAERKRVDTLTEAIISRLRSPI